MTVLSAATRSARRTLSRFRQSRSGTAAVEFAIVVPALLTLMGGVVEFGRIFQVYGAVNRLATQYAIAWSDCSDYPAGACATELATYTPPKALANLVPQLTASNLTLSMFQVQMNGTTPAVVYAYPASATLSAAQVVAAQAAFPSGQSGVLVTVSYAHSLVYFQTLMQPLLGSKLNPSLTVTQLK